MQEIARVSLAEPLEQFHALRKNGDELSSSVFQLGLLTFSILMKVLFKRVEHIDNNINLKFGQCCSFRLSRECLGEARDINRIQYNLRSYSID